MAQTEKATHINERTEGTDDLRVVIEEVTFLEKRASLIKF
jgi:hypothetical protein